jgi:Protein of unknown function (DUF3574)
MTRIRFYVGTETREGEKLPESAFEYAERILTTTWSGFTRFEATGAWVGSMPRKIVREHSRVYEVVTENASTKEILSVAEDLREVLMQSSVLWAAEDVKAGFVSG